MRSAEANERLATLDRRLKSVSTRLDSREHGVFQFKYEDFGRLTCRKKGGGVTKMILKPSQEIIVDEVNDMMRCGLPVRINLLKARKFGGSTLFTAMTYILIKKFALVATMIGHKDTSRDNVYEMIHLFYRKDPDRGSMIEHETKNAKQMKFSGGGSVWVASAGAPDAVTSTTNQIILATELALWPGDPDDQLRSLLNTVSDTEPLTFIFIESTARGVGNTHHERWKQANLPGSRYRPIFIGFLQCSDEYHLPFASPEARDKFMQGLSADEEVLAKPEEENGFGASPEQLLWRRDTLMNKCRGITTEEKIQDFHSEYPVYPEEAFEESGSAIFEIHRVNKMYRDAQNPIFKGDIILYGGANFYEAVNDKKIFDLSFRRSGSGRLQIWEHPELYMEYHAGADVAEGIEIADRLTDDSAICVRRQDNGKVVATWRGKSPPEEFADLIKALGEYFNTMFVCCEVNNHGQLTLARLWKQYPKRKIYHHYIGRNVGELEAQERIGFLTTSKNKPYLLDIASYAVRQNQAEIHDVKLLEEMLTLRREPNGKVITHGFDLTMAFCFSEECRIRMAVEPRQIREKTKYEKYREYRRERMLNAQAIAIYAQTQAPKEDYIHGLY